MLGGRLGHNGAADCTRGQTDFLLESSGQLRIMLLRIGRFPFLLHTSLPLLSPSLSFEPVTDLD